MLQSLKIQNIALIPQVEIEFDTALNVLTGETGAGKSIIIGSFNFILGEKLNKTVIRTGANFAKVDAVFTAPGAVLAQITKMTGIEFSDQTAIFTRTLKADGKSECRINGDIVTNQTLKDAAGALINIHGQHEHEVLLKPKNHIQILDGFGGGSVRTAKRDFNEQYEILQALNRQFRTYGGTDTERDRMADILQYQIKEIEDAHLRENEDVILQEKRQRMLNFEKLNDNVSGALQACNADGVGVRDTFKTMLSLISSVAALDTKIEHIHESAKSIGYDIEDISDALQSYLENLDYDEQEFRMVDARLDEIKILKRKYGSTVDQIFAFLNEARSKLEFLSRSAQDIEALKNQINEQVQVVFGIGQKLTEARKAAAASLEHNLITHLKELGMPSCQFEVNFVACDPAVNGCDAVEFMFSANAGESAKPLSNIISGGEMSRFMLALKTVTARLDSIPTLVFDEIDTGIGGTMGINIATKMAALSKFSQVIAVTHLPQIAAMADTHFLIKKTEHENKTITSVQKLSCNEQIAELARMIGGAATGESAVQHAQALKNMKNMKKG